MSGFNAGANCFLSSELKEKSWGPNPVTVRGGMKTKSIHINLHKYIISSSKLQLRPISLLTQKKIASYILQVLSRLKIFWLANKSNCSQNVSFLGKYIVVRNLDNPADTFIYRGHAAPTTVAKFSPNGFCKIRIIDL